MYNFEFHNPTRIVFGKGTIARLSDLIPQGHDVVLCFGGGSIKTNGVYDQVKKALGERIKLEWGGIPANPEYSILMECLGQVKKCVRPFLLAVGGGSVLDGVKFIAMAAHYNGEPWDILSKGARADSALPLASVLTLPATGSESNGNAVISRRETNEKFGFGSPLVFPAFAILDPETTYSLDSRQTANGVVDTFVHVCEQYLTKDLSTPIQDRQAEGILDTLISHGRAVLMQARNYDLRAAMMWASTQALNELIGCGVVQDWSTHMIGHELTAIYGLDHAQTLAIVLPGVLEFKKQAKFDKLLTYARRVWNLHQGDDRVLVDEAIGRTVLFFESLGVNTRLSDYHIDASEAADKVAERFATRNWKVGEDHDIDADMVRAILLSRA